MTQKEKHDFKEFENYRREEERVLVNVEKGVLVKMKRGKYKKKLNETKK